MKNCNKCKNDKDFNEFGKRSNGTYKSICKTCKKEYLLEYRAKNLDKIKKKQKEWKFKNADKIKEYLSLKIKETKAYQSEYRKANKEKRRINQKEYRNLNKERIKENKKNWRTTQLEINSEYKLKKNIRSLISRSIKKGNYTKSSRTHAILGCSYEEFLIHLNDNPYNFVYEDGLFDLDHIIPISEAVTEDDIIRLNHFTNFQLLPSKYNRNIKLNNKWDIHHFENWLQF